MTEDFWLDENGNKHYGKKVTVPLTKQNPTINVKLQNSDQVENLERKVADYEEKLTKASVMVFESRAEKALEDAERLGLSFSSISSPEELKAVERQIASKSSNTGNRDLPLSSQQLGRNNKSVINQEFLTVSDMVTALDAQNTPESRDAVKKILRQTQRTGVSTFEFEGSLKKLKENQNEIRKYKKVR